MYRFIAGILCISAAFLSALFVLSGCSNERANPATITPIAVYTPWSTEPATASSVTASAATPTASPIATLAPSPTPQPTDTATPSPTATTTATALPTATPSPQPTPTEAAVEPPTEASALIAMTPVDASVDRLPAEIATLLSTADPANGEQLTVVYGCIACHSLQAMQTMVGPSWHNLGAVAATRVEGQSAEAYLYASIVEPNVHLVDGFQAGLMPATYQDMLTAEQIADIIAYLLTLKAD
ncbi:MAG: c-type cytochrome [Caldilinea sp.]|nr:c-type cytochrome [Caldilinea sp.]MDW8439553.1 c-type cytochrome [Caldilineaceae bacterium]